VAVTVEGAPPGTDVGDREIPSSAGEQVAAVTARVRADWTARAGCTQIITAATKRETVTIARTETRVITNHRPLKPAQKIPSSGLDRAQHHSRRAARRDALSFTRLQDMLELTPGAT
jgi:hypothetical protein